MSKDLKRIHILQQLIIKGVGSQTKYFPESFTIKLLKSEFTKKPVTCNKITLRPILIDKYFAGNVMLIAKTEACTGKYVRMKEQHNIMKIKDISALEALVHKLYSKNEAIVLMETMST